MVRIRRTCVCWVVLLITVVNFMIGFMDFHLGYRIVHAGQQKEHSSTIPVFQTDTEWTRAVSAITVSSSQEPQQKNVSNPAPPQRFHLLINSYMNSGSRFTAGMFGFREDSFYFYEPLWRLGLWDYFHKPNYVCSSLHHMINCTTKTADQVNVYKDRGRMYEALHNTTAYTDPVDMMTDILSRIYQCQLVGLGNLVVPGVQDVYGGPGWQAYKSCIRARKPKLKCLQLQEESCKSAKHIVTKVLRLTTASLEALLQSNTHIKVIHLFRDPRAVENSRLDSKGYPSRDAISNARTLCDKMALDYQGGRRLMEKFPGRFKFVFYEDIKSNTEENIKILYDFIGMTFNQKEFGILNKVKTNDAINRDVTKSKSRLLDNAGWWRRYIPFSKYKAIEGMCTDIIGLFNLTVFASKKSLTDLTVPSMTLPSILRIRNITLSE